jgi:GntR family transcriptional regulator, transcriptional repressor for pyruvate dehydrogenase complex
MSVAEFLSPVTGTRMSSEIVSQIIALIRGGRLVPGDRLPAERELAETFGVSRVTVRDALRVLEATGLVDIRVGSAGGAFVTKPSPAVVGETLSNMLFMGEFEPEQIAETRLIVELGVLDLVLERATEEDIAGLRDLCRRSREKLEAGEYDTKLSVRFHAQLAHGAHNPAVVMLAETFSGPLSMAAVRAKEVRGDAHRRTVEEHEALVDCIALRDADGARETLVTHLLRGREMPQDTARLRRKG